MKSHELITWAGQHNFFFCMLVDNISVILCTDFYSRILRSSLRTYAPDIGMILYYSLILHPQYRFDSKVSHPSTLSRLSVFVQYMQHIQTMENSLNTGENPSSTGSLISEPIQLLVRLVVVDWISLWWRLYFFFLFSFCFDIVSWTSFDRVSGGQLIVFQSYTSWSRLGGTWLDWPFRGYASRMPAIWVRRLAIADNADRGADPSFKQQHRTVGRSVESPSSSFTTKGS